MEQALNELFYTTFMNTRNLYLALHEKFPDITYQFIQEWLDKQPLYQIHKNVSSGHGHFYVSKPNHLHQMDLLYMPNIDGYRYILCIVDTASRYKAARALKTKVCNAAIEDIYRTGPLTWPNQMNCDSGPEFMGYVKRMMQDHNVTVHYAPVGYHNSQAMVERFNRDLSQRLFKYMEWHNTWDWKTPLDFMITQLNDEVNTSIKMKPKDAILLSDVRQKNYNDNFGKYNIGDFVRYKLLDDEYQYIDDNGVVITKQEKRRATDATFSLDVFMIIKKVDGPDQTLYYLDQVQRPFVESQLLLVPMDHFYQELPQSQP
jgi:hypothetical protein